MNGENALRTAGGGVIGTAVLSFLLLLIEVQTRSRIRIGTAISEYLGMPDQQAVAVVVFVLVTALVWPFVFVFLEARELLPGRTRWKKAVIFAAVLAVAFGVAGRGELGGPALVLYGVGVLGAYVAYGLTLARVLRPVGRSE